MQKVKMGFYYFLILVYLSGVIGMCIRPSFFLPFTPYTLLYTVFVFLIFQPIQNSKYIISFLLIAVIGYASEVIGVKTGLVFGNYHYGNNLGYKLLDVPLIISLNWALLVNLSVLVSSRIVSTPFFIALFTAIIATSLDFLIEQVAPHLNFWYFNTGFAQLHNYLGWFAICFITAYIFNKELIKGNKKIGTTILVLQVLFFGVLILMKV
ncbi:MAG: carotenoid biosynthesis protein [Bacteroidota bacterium]|nr:carotenoid biosynthesis protein [Bacteroidota bacterium]